MSLYPRPALKRLSGRPALEYEYMSPVPLALHLFIIVTVILLLACIRPAVVSN